MKKYKRVLKKLRNNFINPAPAKVRVRKGPSMKKSAGDVCETVWFVCSVGGGGLRMALKGPRPSTGLGYDGCILEAFDNEEDATEYAESQLNFDDESRIEIYRSELIKTGTRIIPVGWEREDGDIEKSSDNGGGAEEEK